MKVTIKINKGGRPRTSTTPRNDDAIWQLAKDRAWACRMIKR